MSSQPEWAKGFAERGAARREGMVQWLKEGKSVAEVIEEFGVSGFTVECVAKAAGVVILPRYEEMPWEKRRRERREERARRLEI